MKMYFMPLFLCLTNCSSESVFSMLMSSLNPAHLLLFLFFVLFYYISYKTRNWCILYWFYPTFFFLFHYYFWIFITFLMLFWYDRFSHVLIIIFYHYLLLLQSYVLARVLLLLLSCLTNPKKCRHQGISSLWCVCSKCHYFPTILLKFSTH